MNCKECGAKLIQLKGRRVKEFCNSSCRSKYWHTRNRAKKKSTVKEVLSCLEKPDGVATLTFRKAKKSPKKALVSEGLSEVNYMNPYEQAAYDSPSIPPQPVIQPGEDKFDFAARKNEWKKLYSK